MIFIARGGLAETSLHVMLGVSAIGASPQSSRIEAQLAEARTSFALPASRQRDRLRERFQELCRSWKKDTRWVSSTTEMAMHPSYQRIIGMGPDALPLILGELKINSGHWFWALKSITGEDPVPPRDRGAIKAMRNAWLEWGKAKGYLSS